MHVLPSELMCMSNLCAVLRSHNNHNKLLVTLGFPSVADLILKMTIRDVKLLFIEKSAI